MLSYYLKAKEPVFSSAVKCLRRRLSFSWGEGVENEDGGGSSYESHVHSPGHKSEKGMTKLPMDSDSGVF